MEEEDDTNGEQFLPSEEVFWGLVGVKRPSSSGGGGRGVYLDIRPSSALCGWDPPTVPRPVPGLFSTKGEWVCGSFRVAPIPSPSPRQGS